MYILYIGLIFIISFFILRWVGNCLNKKEFENRMVRRGYQKVEILMNNGITLRGFISLAQLRVYFRDSRNKNIELEFIESDSKSFFIDSENINYIRRE